MTTDSGIWEGEKGVGEELSRLDGSDSITIFVLIIPSLSPKGWNDGWSSIAID